MSHPPPPSHSASSSTAPSSAAVTPPAQPRPPFSAFGPIPADNPLSSSGPFTSAPLITSGVNHGPRRPDYKGKRKASDLTGDGASQDGTPAAADDDDEDVPVEPGPEGEGELEAAAAVLGEAAQASANAKKRRETDKEKKKIKVGARASIACKTCRCVRLSPSSARLVAPHPDPLPRRAQEAQGALLGRVARLPVLPRAQPRVRVRGPSGRERRHHVRLLPLFPQHSHVRRT